MNKERQGGCRVILEGGEGVYEEKKSRFIATIRKCESEQEAVAFIEEMKKKYWDARHNCSAYVLGSRAEITRCSDDGEPGGTAGRPMLETLLASGVRNAAVVVTRYFGGTLLGTGGLVRAYTQAVQTALSDAVTAVMTYGFVLRLQADYNAVGKIQYLCAQQNIAIQSSDYAQNVTMQVFVPQERREAFVKKITEAGNGKIAIEEVEQGYRAAPCPDDVD